MATKPRAGKLDLSDESGKFKPDVSDINLRILAAASAFSSKEEARYNLTGVCLEIEPRSVTYIATDGHCLICYHDEKESGLRDNRLIGAYTIPAVTCKVYKLDKDDDGAASIFHDSGRLTIAHNMTDITFVPIEAQYPDWRKAIPRRGAAGTLAQYSFKALDGYRKFAEALNLPAPPFLAPNGDGPGIIWFFGRPEAFGIIMPHRAMDLLRQKPPSWALRGGPVREQTDLEDEDLLRHPEVPLGDEATTH